MWPTKRLQLTFDFLAFAGMMSLFCLGLIPNPNQPTASITATQVPIEPPQMVPSDPPPQTPTQPESAPTDPPTANTPPAEPEAQPQVHEPSVPPPEPNSADDVQTHAPNHLTVMRAVRMTIRWAWKLRRWAISLIATVPFLSLLHSSWALKLAGFLVTCLPSILFGSLRSIVFPSGLFNSVTRPTESYRDHFCAFHFSVLHCALLLLLGVYLGRTLLTALIAFYIFCSLIATIATTALCRPAQPVYRQAAAAGPVSSATSTPTAAPMQAKAACHVEDFPPSVRRNEPFGAQLARHADPGTSPHPQYVDYTYALTAHARSADGHERTDRRVYRMRQYANEQTQAVQTYKA